MQENRSHDYSEHQGIEDNRIFELRKKLEDPGYMAAAVQELAGELTIEIMESAYGIPFH